MISLDFYSLLSKCDSYKEDPEEARKCKFCSKSEPETAFNNISHIIPELLGNNDSIYLNECDLCNNLLSKYESHLAIFLRPYLILNNIKGKRKVPQFQSRLDGAKTITEFISADEKKRELYVNENLDDFEIDEENKKFYITFRKSPFTPLKVYKSIARIGMSLLPHSELKKYKHVCEWIISDNDNSINFYPYAFISILTKRKFEKPIACLYKANNLLKDNELYPDLSLILGSANVVIQIFIPYSTEFDALYDGKRNLSIELFPAQLLDDLAERKTIRISQIDLSLNENIKQNHQISLSYEDYIKDVSKSD